MISIIYISVTVVCALAADGSGDKKNNERVVHLKGGEEVAQGVARDIGLAYKDNGQQVISEKSMYHLSERDYETYDDEKEQADLNRFLNSIKDTSTFKNCKTGTFSCTTFPSHLLAYLEYLGQTDVAKLGTISTDPAYSTTLSTYQGTTKHLSQDSKQLSAYAVRFNDPNWRKQWYMQDYRTYNYPVMDHNIVPVIFKELSQLNYDLTGYQVTVGVLGDGVQEHPDLGDNYVSSMSYNFCSGSKGSTPSIKYTAAGSSYDSLGTSSAGVIAMKAHNNMCGVGIAPKARIAGIRMTGCDNPVQNIEASALKYNLDNIDIYCNTWTTNDEQGNQLVQLSSAVESALKLGVSEGRNKKGAIYVFPSGSNRMSTNCATNGYVNNPYGITIASASSDGKFAIYSERCSAVFATAYSGDKYADTEVITTILADGGCGKYPLNKSVGPAVAAGIFALVLQDNPSLTYRDMMHLIAMTAEVAPLANSDSWYRNGRGFWVSNNFGFGLLNAKNMINLAKNWQPVPKKHVCVLSMKFSDPLFLRNPAKQSISFDGSKCNVGDRNINYVEHVELVSTIDYTFRGALYINIKSPAKTSTEMLEVRSKDLYRDGVNGWNIMSVHNWGENPHGFWEITVMAANVKREYRAHGSIWELTLKLHGTAEKPAHYNQARNYAAFRLPDGTTNAFV